MMPICVVDFSQLTPLENKISVLVGDYLLSQGLLLSLENKEYDLLQRSKGSKRNERGRTLANLKAENQILMKQSILISLDRLQHSLQPVALWC